MYMQTLCQISYIFIVQCFFIVFGMTGQVKVFSVLFWWITVTVKVFMPSCVFGRVASQTPSSVPTTTTKAIAAIKIFLFFIKLPPENQISRHPIWVPRPFFRDKASPVITQRTERSLRRSSDLCFLRSGCRLLATNTAFPDFSSD